MIFNQTTLLLVIIKIITAKTDPNMTVHDRTRAAQRMGASADGFFGGEGEEGEEERRFELSAVVSDLRVESSNSIFVSFESSSAYVLQSFSSMLTRLGAIRRAVCERERVCGWWGWGGGGCEREMKEKRDRESV